MSSTSLHPNSLDEEFFEKYYVKGLPLVLLKVDNLRILLTRFLNLGKYDSSYDTQSFPIITLVKDANFVYVVPDDDILESPNYSTIRDQIRIIQEPIVNSLNTRPPTDDEMRTIFTNFREDYGKVAYKKYRSTGWKIAQFKAEAYLGRWFEGLVKDCDLCRTNLEIANDHVAHVIRKSDNPERTKTEHSISQNRLDTLRDEIFVELIRKKGEAKAIVARTDIDEMAKFNLLKELRYDTSRFSHSIKDAQDIRANDAHGFFGQGSTDFSKYILTDQTEIDEVDALFT